MSNETGYEEFYDLADRYLSKGRFEEAIDLYRKLLEMNPNDDSLLFSLAWAYRDGGHVDEAIRCFEELVEKELSRRIFTGFAFDELVRIYREGRVYEKLVNLCERAVAVQPGDMSLLTTLGDSCLRVGKIERAIEVFETMTRMEPDSPVFFGYLGNAYVAAGEYGKAEVAYTRAGDIEPTETHTFYNKLATAYEMAGQCERAEESIRKAIEAQPQKAIYYCSLGDIMVKQENIEEAKAAYERAIKIDEKGRAAYYNRLAHTLAQGHYVADAIVLYEQAIETEPQNPFYYLSLIEVCTHEGLDEKARDVYEEAKSKGVLS